MTRARSLLFVQIAMLLVATVSIQRLVGGESRTLSDKAFDVGQLIVAVTIIVVFEIHRRGGGKNAA